MDVCSRRLQCAALLLFVCGCLQAVTIAPLPYTGNEPGYRLPRGAATFLDQEEANRIRREMLGDRGFAGFYGGSSSDSSGYGREHSYDGGDRYSGNAVDRDVYYDKTSRDYYPNYKPDGGSRNTWEDCYLQAEPYDNNGKSSYNSPRSGYYNHRGYGDNRHGIYNRNRGRGYDGHGRWYQSRYDTNRSGFFDAWGRGGYYGNSNKEDSVGEGTVGFYGKSRRQ